MALTNAAPDGYLNVMKPPGMTSHDVVARVRRIAGERRVGHAGTLDPEAIGVLPVAIGRRATRTVSSPTWDVKCYAADVRFGLSTSTDDASGEPVGHGDPTRLTPDAITRALSGFVGTIEQRPPSYSAVHVEGVRSYQRARRGHAEPPPARSVRVDAIRVLRWSNPRLMLLIQCRSGTYIRSIARDLGVALLCPSHLESLLRLRVGPFRLEDAVTIELLQSLRASQGWRDNLWPIDVVAPLLPSLIADSDRQRDFAHGRSWAAETSATEGSVVNVYDQHGEFLGFAQLRAGLWSPVRSAQGVP